jgi:DNA helicase-2/ATP-dependent DNA helicase PcrA
MLPVTPTQLAEELDQRFRAQCARLDLDEPWFGRFELERAGKTLDYLIGHQRSVDERIIDWRSPLAQAYYETLPGHAFELDLPLFAPLAGTVTSRASISHAARRIRRVELTTTSGTVVVVAGDKGFVSPEQAAGGKAAQEGLVDIAGLLTPEQYRLITSSRKSPVIIQGRAGSGKTSVALYRVAWLTWPDAEAREVPVAPERVLIVMFNKALSSFVRSMLKPLKLDGVQLDTFHAWALAEVKRAYRGTITISTDERPGMANAVALKKHLGILRATEAFVQRQTAALTAWLKERLTPYDRPGTWLARFTALTQPPARRLAMMRAAALRERDEAPTRREQSRLTEVHSIFSKAVDRFTQYKEELLKLLTDRELLGKHLPDAMPWELDDLSRFQQALQSEGGTDRRPGTHVAFEDLAILLRLIQLKHGGFPSQDRDDEVRMFDHLVIDEAQDFGAVELNVLLASVRSRTGVTIVGDVNQKIVQDAKFMGWDALAAELGMAGAAVARLSVAHRSTAPIMAVADALVKDRPSGGRLGPRPAVTVIPRDELLDRVGALVRQSHDQDPAGHVCIVFAHSKDARAFHPKLLAHLGKFPVPVRYCHSRDFDFGAGVTVTSLRQVKGLEFDTVILVDPNDDDYPDSEQGRRNLYTMVTRAKEVLHFVALENPGKLLKAAIDAGTVDLVDETEVKAVTFGADEEDPF